MFDLQYFAEEADTGAVTETPVAGETKEVKSFDELIEGEYRDEYKAKVESIVKQRLKDHSQTKRSLNELTELIGELGRGLELESNDPKDIVAAAIRAGRINPAEAEEAFSRNEEEGAGNITPDPTVVAEVKELAGRVAAAKEFYPDLDIAKELSDGEFAALLRLSGGDPKRAYELKYHDLILTNAMHYAVKATESRLSDSLEARGSRPFENAVKGSAAVVINTDPKSLTKAQRSEIKKRVRRGEKILW